MSLDSKLTVLASQAEKADNPETLDAVEVAASRSIGYWVVLHGCVGNRAAGVHANSGAGTHKPRQGHDC